MYYTISEEHRKRLENDFTYHEPHGDQPERYEGIRNAAMRYAEYLIVRCPPSRELSLALTHIEEAMMLANASIARNEA